MRLRSLLAQWQCPECYLSGDEMAELINLLIEERKAVRIKDTNFQITKEACERFGFTVDITNEMIWNTAYQLGRRRWYWGPAWMVNLIGWINTKLSSLRPKNPVRD